MLLCIWYALWILLFMPQVTKGYHMHLRKFVAVKRVNAANKVTTGRAWTA